MAWVNEIYDTIYDENTVCVACISYGKDSLAMLRAIKLLGLPLHRIVHTEVWATQTIPADLPPMVEFKAKADKIIKDLYGIEVEHICATKSSHSVNVERERERERATRTSSTANLIKESLSEISTDFLAKLGSGVSTSNMTEKLTYEDIFYRTVQAPRRIGNGIKRVKGGIYGFATRSAPYCTGELKTKISKRPKNEGHKTNIIQYLGIAPDEPMRVARHIGKKDVILPLVEIGWEEPLCGLISQYQDLLSPIYTTSMRGGCWFCHNQSVGMLRLLRKNYPDLWKLLLKWDKDSPVTFHADGHTVHDFDRRFALEDEGLISADEPWRWDYLTNRPIQLKLF